MVDLLCGFWANRKVKSRGKNVKKFGICLMLQALTAARWGHGSAFQLKKSKSFAKIFRLTLHKIPYQFISGMGEKMRGMHSVAAVNLNLSRGFEDVTRCLDLSLNLVLTFVSV